VAWIAWAVCGLVLFLVACAVVLAIPNRYDLWRVDFLLPVASATLVGALVDREERRELQQAMAYDREMELQQMRETMAGPPRRRLRRVSPTPTNRPPAPNPNERE
jgi:hypothetical protein